MTRIPIVIAVAALLTPAIHAQISRPAIRFFFSSQAENVATIPPEYGQFGHLNIGIVPTFFRPRLMFLYAMVEGTGVWDNISLNVVGADGPIHFINSTLDDTPGARILRWHEVGDFDGSFSGNNQIAVNAFNNEPNTTYVGLQHPYPVELDILDEWGDQIVAGADGRSLFYLGTAFATGGGLVYLRVGDQGITRAGGNPNTDSIYFGFNDAPVRGNQIGAQSDLPDLVVEPVPEPATAALFLAGVLLVRRRCR
jgi:hypothetical protein